MPETIVIRERAGRRALSLAQRVEQAIRSYTIGPISVKDPSLAKLFGDGYQTSAGITVTDENVYTFSAVYDAVNQSSGDLAKLPLNLKKRRQGGGSDDFIDSSTHWLVKHEANPDMSAFEFRRTLQAHALTCKGAFAEIERDSNEKPKALWPLTPDRVTPFIEKIRLANGNYRSRLRYRLDGDSKNILEAKNILHIRGLGYDGYCAYPVIDKARQTIGIALAAQQFAGAFFGNNSNFGGILTADGQDLDEPQAKDIQDRIERTHKGADRAWRLLVLGAGFKYNRTGITPAESQMDTLRSKQVEEVARFFNFPVHKLKNLDRATNNNIEHLELEYYKGHQLTWITNWEQELNRKLISPLEIGIQYFKHNVNAALRGDTAARTAFYMALLDRGVINADDILEWEDMNPQPNGQGKMYLVQGAMVPKDKVEAIASALIKKNENKGAPPPAPPATNQQVQDANARAERAEALAEETRAAAQVEREARLAAEATGTSTAAELVALRESEARTAALAAQLTTLSDELRRRADEVQAVNATLTVDLAQALEARTAAETQATEALATVARAETAREEQVRLALVATASAQSAIDAAASAEARAAAAETAARTATTDVEAAQAARVEAERIATEARTAATAAETARAEALETVTRATADVDRATAEAGRLAAEAAAATTVAEARAVEAEAARDAAEQEAAAHRTAAAEAAAALTTARAGICQTCNGVGLLPERAMGDPQGQMPCPACPAGEAMAAQIAASTLAATEASARAITATEALAREVAERADERTHRAAAESQVAELDAQLATLRAERDTTAAAAVEQGRRAAELERSATDARAQLASLTALLNDTRGTHDVALSALQTAVTALERDRDEARVQTSAHEAAAAASAALVTAREADLRTVRQADAGAIAATIAAHRGLFVDIMRRMVERETDRARRAQITPEKLRRWLETFYEGHADLMRSALLPAVRVHLAFIRSDEDPVEATRRLVHTHVAESERQLRNVLEGDADEIAASLPALLVRWDLERPTVLADALMVKELDYGRRL